MRKGIDFWWKIKEIERQLKEEIVGILNDADRKHIELPKFDDGEGADWSDCLVVSYHNGFTGDSENVTVYKVKVLEDGTIKLYLEGEFGDEFTATADELSTDDLCMLYEKICNLLGVTIYEGIK